MGSGAIINCIQNCLIEAVVFLVFEETPCKRPVQKLFFCSIQNVKRSVVQEFYPAVKAYGHNTFGHVPYYTAPHLFNIIHFYVLCRLSAIR